MEVFVKGHDYFYEVADILKNFCDREEIEFTDKEVPAGRRSLFVHSAFMDGPQAITLLCVIADGRSEVKETSTFPAVNGDELEKRKQYKRMVKHNLLKTAERFFGKSLPWGILSGIRPVKIVHQLLDQGCSNREIFDRLTGFYRLSPEKAKLILDIGNRERRYIFPYNSRRISIYISIPFCPTRCSYCSFPSNEMGRWGFLTGSYLECLTAEMEAVHSRLKNLGYSYHTIYIGGGTPTALNHNQLRVLLDKTAELFVTKDTAEFTVEAGRPDTLDRGKLEMMKEMGVSRISINPQSMNAVTLDRIGRHHTPEDIIEAFELARETGHRNINMDIIIGLPGEDRDMVINTLEKIRGIRPEGLTVHTLAIKRASRLNQEVSYADWVKEEEVAGMLQSAACYAAGMGMESYYLYRQKYMVGDLENIGYSLPGYEGIYNMQIMEEKQTIIGMGAGAVSKLVYLDQDRLERVANIKNLEYYISRLDRVIEKKLSWLETL